MKRQSFVVALLIALVPSVAIAQEQTSVDALIDKLGASDAVTRARAACEISTWRQLPDGRPSATALVPVLAVALRDGSKVESDACKPYRNWGNWGNGKDHGILVGQESANALAKLHDHGVAGIADVFLSAIREQSNHARANAAWGLGVIEHSSAVAVLVEVLSGDDYMRAREEAAWALGIIERDQDGAVEALLDALLRDKGNDATVREQAAWALGIIGAQRSAAALVDALADDAADVREQVAWALGIIENPVAIPSLMNALDDADADVREQTAWALGIIGSSDAVPGLLRGLDDSDEDVREQVAWALGIIGDSRAEDALIEALKDKSPSVRKQAAWALSMVM